MADFAAEVRRFLEMRGTSLRALASKIGYDPGYLSKVISGSKPLSPHVAHQVDAALEAGGAIVSAAAAHAASRALSAGTEQVRRELDRALGEGAMADSDISDWERTAVRYGYATRDRPAPLLLADLTGDLGELRRTIDAHRSASALRRLALVTSQMSGMVCLTLVKMGDRSAFRRWARTARHAASEAGSPPALAWVSAQEAYGYYYAGDYREAAECAQHAQSVVRGGTCVGAALAAALEMRAHAAMGDAEQARAALGRAEEITGQLEQRDLAASAFGYRESQLRFHESSAFTSLRDLPAAARAQRKALELIPREDYTDWAMTHLDMAVCAAYRGDADEAASVATATLLELTPLQRQGIITARGYEVIAEMPATGRDVPLARDLHEVLMLTGKDSDAR